MRHRREKKWTVNSTVARLVFAFFIGLACLNATGLALAQAGSKERRRIAEITNTLKTGDEAAIRELAELVWSITTNNKTPAEIAQPLKERLVRAEIDYRNGKSEGIPESKVVDVVNYLAKEFDAPVYAQAELDEVKTLRAGQAYPLFHSLAPNLAAMSEAERKAVPLQINSSMSPIEAAYFTLTLVFQKELNPCNQLTADERSQVETTLKALETGGLSSPKERGGLRWALCNREADSEKLHLTPEQLAAEVKIYSDLRKPIAGKPYLLGLPSSPRYLEMQTVFKRAYSTKPDDAIVLMNQSFDLLGVEK